MKKKLLAVLLAVALCVSMLPISALAADEVSSGQCGDNVYWSLDSDGTLTISGEGEMWDYPGIADEVGYDTIKAVVIEDGVTYIGTYSFAWCTEITSLTLPENEVEFGYYVFTGCEGLADDDGFLIMNGLLIGYFGNAYEVTVPETVTSIDDYAFTSEVVQIVNIGSSVTYISTAFYYSYALTAINVSDENENYVSLDGVLYTKDMSTLVCYPRAKEGSSYEIPDGVTEISDYAFFGNVYIESVSIPDSIEYIGGWAFSGCTSLSEVDTKGAELGYCAFQLCESLADDDGFIIVDGILYGYVGEETDIIIPDTVTRIAFHAFNGNITRAITSVVIPDSVTYIESYAFAFQYELESVIIGDGVTELGYCDFYYCTSLSEVTLGSSLEIIGAWCFEGTVLTSITIPASVTYIDEGAFWYCETLEEVIFESDETEYAENAFEGVPAMTPGQLYVGWPEWSDEDEAYYYDGSDWTDNWGTIYPSDENNAVFFIADTDDDGNIIASTIVYIDPDEVEADWSFEWDIFADLEDYSAVNSEDEEYFFHIWGADDSAWYQEFTFTWYDEDGNDYVLEGNSYINDAEWYTALDFGNYEALRSDSGGYNPVKIAEGDDTGSYIYLGSIAEEDEMILYLADEDGNIVLAIGDDGSISLYEEADEDYAEYWAEYYGTYCTFEWVTDEEGHPGLKISLSDEAINSGFYGNVYIYISWMNENGDTWDWGTWDWYFWPEGALVYSETDLFAGDNLTNYEVEFVFDYYDDFSYEIEYVSLEDGAESISTELSLKTGKSSDIYIYTLDYLKSSYLYDEDDEYIGYVTYPDCWVITQVSVDDYYYSDGLSIATEDYEDEMVYGVSTVSADKAGEYSIWICDSEGDIYDYYYPITVTVTKASSSSSGSSSSSSSSSSTSSGSTDETEEAETDYTGADGFVFSDDDGTGTWSWADQYVYLCYDAGFITGMDDGTFDADGTLTRAQAAVIMAKAFELSDTVDISFYDDDGTGTWSWASEYIYACYAAGIITGRDDGTFDADSEITRAELTIMICRAMDLSAEDTESSSFSDTEGHYAEAYIEACVSAGIINGMGDGTFAPDEDITRAQSAAVFARAFGLTE